MAGGSTKQRIQVNVEDGLSTATIGGVTVEVTPDSNVTVYSNEGVQTKAAAASGETAIKGTLISISEDFNTIVLNGATIERSADGHLVISTPGIVITKPAAANDSAAKADHEKLTAVTAVGPQIGDVMPAGHPNAGWIYVGPDEVTGKDFYAAAKDESGTFTFNQAAKQAQSIGAQVPTKSQLDKMYENKDKGGLKGTFNETGSHPAGWYWSSSQTNHDHAWAQRFSDGHQSNTSRYFDSSLRCVR